MSIILKEGESAPDFALPDANGRVVSLGDFHDKKVVLYFYPKDNTPGCTQEARDFNMLLSDFSAQNTTILGISKDSIESHHKFTDGCGLNFTLLSDYSGDVCERYGVWREKSMYGKRYFGIERSTFLIDEHGTILKIWQKVNVLDHAAEVMRVVCSG